MSSTPSSRHSTAGAAQSTPWTSPQKEDSSSPNTERLSFTWNGFGEQEGRRSRQSSSEDAKVQNLFTKPTSIPSQSKPYQQNQQMRSDGKGEQEANPPLHFPSMGPSTSITSPSSLSSIPSGQSSSGRSRPASIATSTGRPIAPQSSSRDQWWENVLPPGMLAERLSRAQVAAAGQSLSPSELRHARGVSPSTSKSSSMASRLDDALRATPTSSYRASWKHPIRQLAMSDVSHKPEVRETLSSATSRRSSKSSVGDFSSGGISGTSGSSSNGESPQGGRSPTLKDESELSYGWPLHGGDRSGSTSSLSSNGHTFSRSKSSRRTRVLSEDGVGLGIQRGTQSLSSGQSELDERFHSWESGHPFGPSKRSSMPPLSGRASPLRSLVGTPEASSEEEQQQGRDDDSSVTSTTTTTTTRRVTRTISTTSYESATPTEVPERAVSKATESRRSTSARRRSIIDSTFDGQAHASGRHVSFNRDVRVAGEPGEVKTLGRSFGRSNTIHNSLASGGEVTLPSSRSLRSFDERSSKPITARLTPQANNSDVKSHAESHIRGKRSASRSAPASPRASIRLRERERPAFGGVKTSLLLDSKKQQTHDARREVGGHLAASKADTEIPDLALLTSLSAAHQQLTSAGNLALALTRQLSAPLRPVLHVTLFVSISTITFMTLSCFLVASYFLTVWDDVNSRGNGVKQSVSAARKNIEASVNWGKRMLTGGDILTGPSLPSDENHSPSEKGRIPSRRHRRGVSDAIKSPFKVAFGVPFTVAYKLTPTTISESLGFGMEPGSSASGSGPDSSSTSPYNVSSGSFRSNAKSGSSHRPLPPRPPLSSLLPSILFTLLIAIGAGLASFFASKLATSTAGTTPTASSSTSASSSSSSSSSAGAAGGNVAASVASSASTRPGRHGHGYSSSMHRDKRTSAPSSASSSRRSSFVGSPHASGGATQSHLPAAGLSSSLRQHHQTFDKKG